MIDQGALLIYDDLPVSEKTLVRHWKHYSESSDIRPYSIRNDQGKPCEYYVYNKDNLAVAVILYYKGRKLAIILRVTDVMKQAGNEIVRLRARLAAAEKDAKRLGNTLANVLIDLDSGHIANHSVNAEKRRNKHITEIRQALAEHEKEQNE